APGAGQGGAAAHVPGAARPAGGRGPRPPREPRRRGGRRRPLHGGLPRGRGVRAAHLPGWPVLAVQARGHRPGGGGARGGG
ncbi:unnamed protein product, partial [Prorocentrum cordatum]